MSLTIAPIGPAFVAEVSGIDMRTPPDAETVRAIVAANDTYAVLIFREQHIDDAQHVAFTRPFGRLETTIKAYRPGFVPRLAAEVADISNLDENGDILDANDRRRMNSLGNRQWHTDYTFKECAGKYSFLRALVVTGEGGETKFTDMRAAYDALSDKKKAEIADLVAEHSLVYSRGLIGFTDYAGIRVRENPVVSSLLAKLVRAGTFGIA